MLGPRPPSFVAPSIWKLEVDTPHTNSGGQVPTCPLDCILAVSSDMSPLLERGVQSSSFLRHARHEARIRDERCWQHAGCHEAVATSNKGEAYYGDATISGKPYPAGCELIKLRVPGKRSRASLYSAG